MFVELGNTHKTHYHSHSVRQLFTNSKSSTIPKTVKKKQKKPQTKFTENLCPSNISETTIHVYIMNGFLLHIPRVHFYIKQETLTCHLIIT